MSFVNVAYTPYGYSRLEASRGASMERFWITSRVITC